MFLFKWCLKILIIFFLLLNLVMINCGFSGKVAQRLARSAHPSGPAATRSTGQGFTQDVIELREKSFKVCVWGTHWSRQIIRRHWHLLLDIIVAFPTQMGHCAFRCLPKANEQSIILRSQSECRRARATNTHSRQDVSGKRGGLTLCFLGFHFHGILQHWEGCLFSVCLTDAFSAYHHFWGMLCLEAWRGVWTFWGHASLWGGKERSLVFVLENRKKGNMCGWVKEEMAFQEVPEVQRQNSLHLWRWVVTTP